MPWKAKPYLATFPIAKMNNFWKNVEKGEPHECWPWKRAIRESGHGHYSVTVNGKTINYVAHRMAWALTHGEPDLNLVVMHVCNHPDCCNPRHLIQGTVRENTRHSKLSGTNARGEKNGHSKMTAAKVRELRRLRKAGWPLKKLGARYGIDPATAHQIAVGTRWAHVGGAVKVKRAATARGAARGNSKLTDAIVRKMRKLADEGYPIADLARRYGVGGASVSMAVNRQTWTHVK